jgi:phosphatidylserine/phosphatidylglycerophosphate/cardiolipin synthase-like enzyme
MLCCLVSILLSACSLTASKTRAVDEWISRYQETVQDCFPRVGDSCAVNSPLLKLGRDDAASGRHHVTLVEYGVDSLVLRVHLIRAAQEYIDVQNFILRKDETGELILNELLDAARRGVSVRLLLDQMFSFSDVEYLAKLAMAHSNMEVRFYNPSFNKAEMAKHDWLTGLACCFRGVNQRMHNKLQVVDDVVGVIGGRNIADRYFEFDTNYEFKDRDVIVFGGESVAMRRSFDWFWDNPKTVPVQYLRDVANKLLNTEPQKLVPYIPSARLQEAIADVDEQESMFDLFVKPAFEVGRLEYFSDRPRKQKFPDDAPRQDITQEIYEILVGAQESVLIQSPYMVLSRRAREVFIDLRETTPGIELVFSTNSLASTDADTVYANTHRHKKRYVGRLGFRMYEFKPFPLDAPDFFPRWTDLIREKKQGIRSDSVVSGDDSTIPMPAPRVGLHSKSLVIDSRVVMIGSHNFDPRSEGFNTENGLIVWDKPFAREVESLIRRDIEPQNSWVVAMKPEGAEAETALAAPADLNPPPATWPRSDTSAYQLAPGKQVVPPGSPDFYQNYYPVGSFPDVVRTRRHLMVVFLGSFFFFLEPIL